MMHGNMNVKFLLLPFITPEKFWDTNSIKAKSLPSISYQIYPSQNTIVKLGLHKHNFIHYLNCIPKAGYLCYVFLYNIIPANFEISNPCNCTYFLFVLVVRMIMTVY